MNLKSIALAAIVGAALGVAGSYFVTSHQLARIDDRLQQSPPIVVVDFPKLALQYPDGATTEDVEALMVRTNTAILKLRDAGYLVIDSSAIISAPEDIYLPGDAVE